MDKLFSERFTDKKIFYYAQVDSTNQIAHQLAEQGALNGTTIIAEEQLKGRGRLGRSWFSPPQGGLWFSIILTPHNRNPAEIPPITLVTAAVIADLLKEKFNLPVDVKWPNDLLIHDKKICGILTETKVIDNKINYLVVGIGLNVNQNLSLFPTELQDKATSMASESSHTYERTTLFLNLRELLLSSYQQFFRSGFKDFKALWKKNNTTLSKQVTVKSPKTSITGLAYDINDAGALIIENEDKITHEIHCGEITKISIG